MRLPGRPRPPLAEVRRPGGWVLLGIGLAILGALIGAGGLVLLGALTLLSRWIATLWSRRGLHGVTYDRRLATRTALWGDEVPLDVEIWNGKPLPVPWLQADDHVTDSLRVRDRRLGASERPGLGTLQNSWSLLWYERVIRHHLIEAQRRGVFSFGPVRLTVADLFERGTASDERELPATLVVRPRSVPVREVRAARAPLGTTPTRLSLFSDPARFAGVRPYRSGEPARRVHWRATARLPAPVSKRFEPVHEREVVIVVDMQTVPGPYWLMLYDDEQVEALCVAAASLGRRLLGEGTGIGLLANAQLAGAAQYAWLAPDTTPTQLARINDLLARIRPIISLPFEQLLRGVPRRLRPGTTLLTLGSRDPRPYVDQLRRLGRIGFRCQHLALGPEALAACRTLAAAGIPAREAQLNPNWRTADALVLAPAG